MSYIAFIRSGAIGSEGIAMRVLIVGASGFIGGRIAVELIAAGHEVELCARHVERLHLKFPSNRVLSCDFAEESREGWLRRVEDVDAVINAAGIFQAGSTSDFEAVHIRGPKALFEACAEAGIRKVLQISALGADATATSQFHLSKRSADERFVALAEQHGMTGWIVLRPSLVIGQGGQSTALFAALAALPWPLRIGPGNWQVQPIHIADFTQAVRLLLENEKPLPSILDIVGPKPMTTDELTLTIRNWLLLRSAAFLPMPERVLRAAARAANFLPTGVLSADSLDMLARGNTASLAPLRQALHWQPSPLEEALAREPATEADLCHARLFFLRPALRIGLALIWIATGVVSAFVYPIEKSSSMVAGLGLSGSLALAAVYAGAALDAVLGFALLFGFRPVLVGLLQIATMLAFTLLATLAMPEAWIEPFGPLLKNLAVLLATIVMIALEAKP